MSATGERHLGGPGLGSAMIDQIELQVGAWAQRRRFRAEGFVPERLAAHKAMPVSVVIPTKECAPTIVGMLRGTVGPLVAEGIVDEVVVVDAGSADGTAELAAAHGARVIQQDQVLIGFGRALGKGDALWRAVHAARGEVICFLDGDTAEADPRHPLGLLGPLLTDPAIKFVKGAFDRPLRAGAVELAHEGGRVTELMARPLLNLHEPLLAGFAQPLAGEFAARRSLLESIPFPVGYGVEIAMLIEALRACGLDGLAECHLGVRRQPHQPLRALGEMAYAVLSAVHRRVDHDHRVPSGRYLRPWDDFTVAEVPVAERPPLASLAASEPVSRQ
jgi:glucosyl-3-phosphoglycerate synthase